MELRPRWQASGIPAALGPSALWLAVAFAGYARLGIGDPGDDGGLALEAASAGLLLVGAVCAIGRLRHVIAARGTTRQARAVAALAFAAILVVATPAFGSYVALSRGLEDMREDAEDQGQATSIVVGPGARDIRLAGEIREGAAQQLETLLAAHPGIARIHLTSEGGLLDEGQALGEVIARHDLVAYVPDYCISACTLAFVRGKARLLMRGARLGFHKPYVRGLFGEVFEDQGDTPRAAYLAAGVAPDFVEAALAVESADLWIPDAERLIAAHVATALVDPYRFPDSNLDGMPTAAVARDVILRNFPALAAIYRADPTRLDPIVAWYLEAYGAARSEGEVHDGLRRLADHAVALAEARPGPSRAGLTVTAARAGFDRAPAQGGFPPRP